MRSRSLGFEGFGLRVRSSGHPAIFDGFQFGGRGVRYGI